MVHALAAFTPLKLWHGKSLIGAVPAEVGAK